MHKEYCVISHTHWDREWYLPFEQLRIRLVELMDNLLELMYKEKDYIFHLDAQTVVLEDYLEIRPDKEKDLKRLISEGRLLVGPWYVQNDFNLVSGEAIIRNLQIGMKIAEKFGRCMMVGYAPDQFGLISQLPQIFKKFDIRSCIFGRGKDNFVEDGKGGVLEVKTKAEFYWESMDGSRILGIYLSYWYNNAQRFSEDIDKSMLLIEKIGRELSETSNTPYYLLMNGVDHLEAQENLLPILNSLNGKLKDGTVIRQYNMEDYTIKLEEALKDKTPEQYIGEMITGEDIKILQGTLSTRVSLKQQNSSCQTILENYLEPLYTWLEILGIGAYPHTHMEYLWKLLVKNHAHDSICGCNVDSVTKHMEDRFFRIREAAQFLIEKAAFIISSHIDRSNLGETDYLLTLFNTASHDRNEVVEAEIYFDKSSNIEDFNLLDIDGKPVRVAVINKNNGKIRRFSPINLPAVIDVSKFKVRFQSGIIAGQSYKTFIVRPHEQAVTFDTCCKDHSNLINRCNTMENNYLKVSINNYGTIDILHKASDKVYSGLLLFEDREDTGNSYIYNQSDRGATIFSKEFEPEIKLEECDCFTTKYSIEYKLLLPVEYDYVNNRRSCACTTVTVKSLLQLDMDCPFLKISISTDNTARDHRIRALFPTKIMTDNLQAGAPFDIVQRDRSKSDLRLNSSACQPFTGFINVDDADGGIAFFAEGLYEYENLNDEDNTVAVTLIRSNGSIFKENQFAAVEDMFFIPGNQCEGKHEFSIAIFPHSGNYLEAEVLQKCQAFTTQLLKCFEPSRDDLLSRGAPFVQDSSISEVFTSQDPYANVRLPLEKQFLKIEGRDITLTAMKASQYGNSIIVRMYNCSDSERIAVINFLHKFKEVYLTNLKEDRISKLENQGDSIKGLVFKPKEIITIELTLQHKCDVQ